MKGQMDAHGWDHKNDAHSAKAASVLRMEVRSNAKPLQLHSPVTAYAAGRALVFVLDIWQDV